MDYMNIEATEINKNKQTELNRTKSVFQQNVAIHVNDEEDKHQMMPPVLKSVNTVDYKVKEQNKSPEEEFSILKMSEQLQDSKLLNGTEVQQDVAKEMEKNMVPLSIQKSESSQRKATKQVAYVSLKPGEALDKYIAEVKNKSQSDKGKVELDSAIDLADKCKMMLIDIGKDKDIGMGELQNCLGYLNSAILQIDRYIKKTKHIIKEKGTIERNSEDRSLREATKMLRIQLFLEKMDLYERIDLENEIEKKSNGNEDSVDERKLYQQQLEEDARAKIYNEYKTSSIEEVVETSKTAINKSRMEQKKAEQLIAEDNRQIAKYSKKISDSEGKARELQEKIQGNGYDVRHKQFQRNEVYQQKLNQKIELLRPIVLEEWLNDNFNCIRENGEKLRAIFAQKNLQSKRIKGIKENDMRTLFEAELKDDESLGEFAQRYDQLFRKIGNLSPSAWPMCPKEIKDLVAAQVVLFEKRQMLKKEYSQINDKVENSSIPKAPPIKYNIPKAPILINRMEQQVVPYGSVSEQQHKQQMELLQYYKMQLQKKQEEEAIRNILRNSMKQEAIVKYRGTQSTDGGREAQDGLVQHAFMRNMQEVALKSLANKHQDVAHLYGNNTENENVDYAERFLKKLDPDYQEPTITEITEEEWLAEQKNVLDSGKEERLEKYKVIHDRMLYDRDIMEKQADEKYTVMMKLLRDYLENMTFYTEKEGEASTALVNKKMVLDSVKDYIISVVGKTPALIEGKPIVINVVNNSGTDGKINKIWKVIDLKWKSVRPAKAIYKMLSDGNANIAENLNQRLLEAPADLKEQELMKFSVEELLKEAYLNRERQSQSEQTQKEKESFEQKRRIEDLEYQRINNEYGLQGMASEEKEREEKRKEKESQLQKGLQEKNETEVTNSKSPERILEQIIASNDIESKEIDEPATIIRKENNKLVVAFMGRYDEMKELISSHANEKDKEGYQMYIDEIKRTFFEKYFENEKQYLEEEQNYSSDKIGDIVREMTEFYAERMLELQALYEPLLSMSGQ